MLLLFPSTHFHNCISTGCGTPAVFFEIVTNLVELTIQMQSQCIGEGITQLYLSLNMSTSSSQSQTLAKVTWETVQMDEKLLKNEQGVSAEQTHESKNNVQLYQLSTYL